MKDQTVTIFGFGSQGSAQALNLRDSGWRVSVYLRPQSNKIATAKKEKFLVFTDPVAAAKETQIGLLLLPDTTQPEFYQEYLKINLPPKAALVFAHGFNIHFKQIPPRPDLDVLLVAPALQGDGLRKHYLTGDTVPILTAVAQDTTDRAYRLVEDLAEAIGGKQTKIFPTTFKEETETDLFAEQAVLCGGVNALVKAGFETLANAGYSPEIAYYSCLKELRALSDALYKYGIAETRKRISQTACFGDLTRGPRIIDAKVRQTLQTLLDEICSGDFTKELLKDKNADWPLLQKRLAEEAAHPIEKTRLKVDP